jgi:hypothetical protein
MGGIGREQLAAALYVSNSLAASQDRHPLVECKCATAE